MILALECVIACAVFTVIMVGGVLWKKEAFLHEYAPEVQRRFAELHPERVPKAQVRGLVLAKLMMSALFIAVLTLMAYLAGAGDFWSAAGYAYIIWAVVNWFDVFALDLGVFAHWKKVRLPGTEDLDREYRANWRKHVKDGFIGMAIGVPVVCACGGLIAAIM